MQSGQWKAGSLVAESWNRLPGILRMACLAFSAKLTSMRVLVAREAFGLETEKGLRLVTLIALNGAVLPFEAISGLRMIER
jgi:hypothetical protein